MNSPRAVIFDLDGTLTDSAPAIGRALNRLWAEMQRAPIPQVAIRGYIGDGPAALIKCARRDSGLEPDPEADPEPEPEEDTPEEE